MTDEFDKDKVLARVRKMLALAHDQEASEGERDNALRMAHATLAKYNLSMAETAVTPDERGVQKNDRKKDAPYMRTIAQAIAQLFFCDFFYTSYRGSRVEYSFVGKTANVATAVAMTDYVIASVRAEALLKSKAVTNPNQYRRSFAKGAAIQIYRRCKEIRTTAEAASAVPSSGTSLVLASLYETENQANRAWLAEHVPGLRTRKASERSTDYGAFADGREYGSRVGLHAQVGTGKPNLKQIS